MATYKLIQDIEAEDHILGPLSLRQFIFALIAVFFYYISFVIFTKASKVLLIPFVPPALFFTFFAIPFGRDQPTEIWALAKIRYFLKPRRRIWDQSGIKELVKITVPKKIEIVRTDGLSQDDVKSRLQALANTLDSRGWAVKNANIGTYSNPNPLLASTSSERLIDLASMPREVPNYDLFASDDILDEVSNPIAQQFESMIAQSSRDKRRHLMEEMSAPPPPPAAPSSTQPANYWFMNQPSAATPGQAMFNGPQTVQPAQNDTNLIPLAANEEVELMETLEKAKKQVPKAASNMRTLQPSSAAPAPQPVTPTAVTPPSDPAILSLASNNDLNVATLAREAHKAKGDDSQDEVVISLH